MSSRIRAQTRRTAEQPMCIGSGDRAAHKASTSDFFHLRCESHVYECTPKWTTNWRAGCGRAASPVRREGEAVRPLPTPIGSYAGYADEEGCAVGYCAVFRNSAESTSARTTPTRVSFFCRPE